MLDQVVDAAAPFLAADGVPPRKYQVSRSSSLFRPEMLSSMTSSSSSGFMPSSLLDLLSS